VRRASLVIAREALPMVMGRETMGVVPRRWLEKSARGACPPVDLSPNERLGQAGVLSGNFWLTKETACQRTFG